jgi:hypothetical protein
MAIEFPVRFIIDEFFIRELIQDKQLASKTLLKLSEIHRTSKHYPMMHNLILDECFLSSIEDKKIRGPALIGAMHPEQCPYFLQCEKDLQTKIIKYSINLSNQKPYGMIILTSKDKLKTYLSNTHYKNSAVQSVIKIFSGEEAIKIIEIVSSYK